MTESTDTEKPTRKHTTRSECQRIRDTYRDVGTIIETAEECGRSRETVRSHINGSCRHTDQEVDEYTSQPTAVSREVCSKLRVKYVVHSKIETVADEVGVSIPTARHHIAGECQHEYDGVPVEKKPIHPYLWDAVAFLYFEHGVWIEHLADEFDACEETIRMILSFYVDERTGD